MAEIVDLYDIAGNLLNIQVPRGEKLPSGQYYLVVTAIIRNAAGELLISRRSAQKKGAGLLETAGGLVTAGENSLEGICREVGEELGLSLPQESFKFLKRYTFETERRYHFDVWENTVEVDPNALNLQAEEVSEAMWMSVKAFNEAIDEGECFNAHIYDRMRNEGLL